MSQRWEYDVIEHDNARTAELAEVLRRAGSDGWELVSATMSFNVWMSKVVNRLFLKRPVP